MTHKAPRGLLNFRLGEAGKDWLTNLAHQHRVGLSEVIRACLAVARKHETEVVARLEDDR